MSKHSAIFVAATGQHVGKTTTCLGLVSGLKKRFPAIGFIKPVGQRGIQIDEDLHVDKDVALFKDYFSLKAEYEDMSPVLLPAGFTRKYLDNEVTTEVLLERIKESYARISAQSDFTVVEGTGHTGVGSIVGLNNAQVASELGLDAILIVSGGLGSAIDELALNKALFDANGVKIRGVIVNRVNELKRSMILDYIPKALKRWDIPLLGCIPYNDFLSEPTMSDLESLFQVEMLSGQQYGLLHFHHMRMVATSAETYKESFSPKELVITSSNREDIILTAIEQHALQQGLNCSPEGGIILTGATAPSDKMIKALQTSDLPALYTPITNYEALKKLTSYIAKIRKEDLPKIREATQLIEAHIDYDALLNAPELAL